MSDRAKLALLFGIVFFLVALCVFVSTGHAQDSGAVIGPSEQNLLLLLRSLIERADFAVAGLGGTLLLNWAVKQWGWVARLGDWSKRIANALVAAALLFAFNLLGWHGSDSLIGMIMAVVVGGAISSIPTAVSFKLAENQPNGQALSRKPSAPRQP